jgi:hypothetical protein
MTDRLTKRDCARWFILAQEQEKMDEKVNKAANTTEYTLVAVEL